MLVESIVAEICNARISFISFSVCLSHFHFIYLQVYCLIVSLLEIKRAIKSLKSSEAFKVVQCELQLGVPGQAGFLLLFSSLALIF